MTRADVELRKLKEKAVEASDSRLEDTVFMDTVAMSGRRRQPVAAIAGVALLVVVVGGMTALSVHSFVSDCHANGGHISTDYRHGVSTCHY